MSEAMTMLIAWASGQRYTTASQAATNYFTRSTRPSQFFSHVLSMRLPFAQVSSSSSLLDCFVYIVTKFAYHGNKTTNIHKVYISAADGKLAFTWQNQTLIKIILRFTILIQCTTVYIHVDYTIPLFISLLFAYTYIF